MLHSRGHDSRSCRFVRYVTTSATGSFAMWVFGQLSLDLARWCSTIYPPRALCLSVNGSIRGHTPSPSALSSKTGKRKKGSQQVDCLLHLVIQYLTVPHTSSWNPVRHGNSVEFHGMCLETSTVGNSRVEFHGIPWNSTESELLLYLWS